MAWLLTNGWIVDIGLGLAVLTLLAVDMWKGTKISTEAYVWIVVASAWLYVGVLAAVRFR